MTLKNACRVYFAEPMEKGFTLYPAPGIKCKLLNDIQGLENNFGNSLETSFSIKSEKDIEYKDSQELVFLKKWTLCEAILKCFGKGFRDHSKLDFLKSECNLRYYLVMIENQKFGFALAIKKEKSGEM